MYGGTEAPDIDQATGCSTAGSSEAAMPQCHSANAPGTHSHNLFMTGSSATPSK